MAHIRIQPQPLELGLHRDEYNELVRELETWLCARDAPPSGAPRRVAVIYGPNEETLREVELDDE